LGQLTSHARECEIRHPPGNEIYRNNELSFFELDGHIQKNYCRNLCLLSKLFLDHKTLYYDVDPFMFYVLCTFDDRGYHIVGYFSKEKDSAQGYNVACLLTLPHQQRKGYGKMLIDFSYLLSKNEGVSASPEKPLSDLGLLSYKTYWNEVIVDMISGLRRVSVSEISKHTSISEDDILGTLSSYSILKFYRGEPIFVLKEKILSKVRKKRKMKVDPGCLKWEVSNFTQGQLRLL
jgi:histone acetyltransferase HTATIP